MFIVVYSYLTRDSVNTLAHQIGTLKVPSIGLHQFQDSIMVQLGYLFSRLPLWDALMHGIYSYFYALILHYIMYKVYKYQEGLYHCICILNEC